VSEIKALRQEKGKKHKILGCLKNIIQYIDWNNYFKTERPRPEDSPPSMAGKEEHKELLWLTKQFEPAKEIFKKYLDISK
jgi:hypothetical protein